MWPLYDPQRFSKNWKLNKQACFCIIFQNLKIFLFISLLLSSIEQWFIFMDFYNGAWTLKVTGDLLGLWFEKKNWKLSQKSSYICMIQLVICSWKIYFYLSLPTPPPPFNIYPNYFLWKGSNLLFELSLNAFIWL